MEVEVLIEIPKGSRNKYEYDQARRVIRFDRMLFSSVHYPCDYGFIPNTLADDGDPLDALVLVSEPTFPGCLIDAKPIAMCNMKDEKGQDEKVLCVPLYDPMWNNITSMEQVAPHLLREIEHFFSIYKNLENKPTDIQGWVGANEAIKTIHACEERYKKSALFNTNI